MKALGADVIAATVGDLDDVKSMRDDLGLEYPLAYGVTEDEFAPLGAWWTTDHHGRYMQPTELLISRGGVVFGSMYASGPIGRMSVQEVIVAIKSREAR